MRSKTEREIVAVDWRTMPSVAQRKVITQDLGEGARVHDGLNGYTTAYLPRWFVEEYGLVIVDE